MVVYRRKMFVAAALATVGVSGYFLYSLFAAQAQSGTLAQAPLNTQVQVQPAFIMAVDDSGSMNFQTLFPGRDGATVWGRDSSSGSGNVYSFYHSTATGTGRAQVREAGTTGVRYVYVAPYPAPRQNAASDSEREGAIPPFDAFGFSRSHQHNRSYFDPGQEYLPWRNEDGTYWDDASPSAARIHPSNAASLNLTSAANLTSTAAGTDSRFTVRVGMVIPANTWYRGSGCGLTSSTSAYREQISAITSNGTCHIHVRYFPATFYLNADAAAPAGYIVANRVFVANGCSYPGATGADVCNMYRYEIRPENYAGGASGQAYQDAIQNFANWFTYYRNRTLSIVSGATNSLAEVNNMRIGQFTINSYSSWDNPVTTASERLPMYDMQTKADRVTLFNQLFDLAVGGTTPNMFAVDAIGQQFRRTDANAPIQRACQRNAGMLFTDGFTNQANMSGFGNADQNMGVPFADSHSNTLADVATHYYLNTNGSIGAGGTSRLGGNGAMPAGQVPVPEACDLPNPDPRLNCQRNLHMNFYGVTLGASGVLYNADSPADPFVTPQAWPAHVNNSANTVDDIWHAAVNTRGDFINAKTPAEITAAMRRILASVSSGASPSGSIAITGARIGAGSLQVTPSYDVRNEGTDWSGDLTAYRVQLNAATRTPESVFAWRASERFPVHGSRDAFFSRGTGAAQRFNATNVSLADMCTPGVCEPALVSALGATATLGNAVAYLLGDVSQEKRNGGPFRDRGTRLGDIVNSNPVVSSPMDDYGYSSLGAHGSVDYGSTYRTYVNTTKASRRYMVYVGANDGMLHAFDGGLTKAMVEAGQAPDVGGGREEFAYIPATSLGKLGNLLFPYDAANQNDQKFLHRYYVDGPITVSDAYYGTGWSTVLVGTSGAGGRSVFALNVSNPTSFGASDRLWEISDLNTSLPQPLRDDLGHVLGKPVVVPVRSRSGNVTWKAIFGNGYESAANGGRGRAVLFMVDIGTGNPVVRRIVAEESSSGLSSTSRNGLGNIVVVDRWGGSGLNSPQRDGFADTVYAADQQGALWKFDIRDAAFATVPTNGGPVETITMPLFRTQEHIEGGGRYRQPILGGLTATSGPNGGVMIYFGTGSFSFLNDPTDANVQSLYAVNDTERVPTTATVASNTLVRYTVTAIAGGTDRTLTKQTNPLNSRGWYVDLPARERFVGNPEIATGVVFMPTYSPNPSASGCSTSGFNSLFGLNARTGAPALSLVRYGSPGGTSPATGTASIGLNTGGTAPVRDVGVMAIPRQGPTPLVSGPPGSPIPPPPAPPEQGCWMMVTVAGAQAMYLPYPCGRQSWRQIQ